VRASLEDNSSGGFGMRAVHQRIRIFFGGNYGLSVDSAPDAGTRVTVTIPMQMAEETAS
jgi:two-component system sensor histidine kinase YesM